MAWSWLKRSQRSVGQANEQHACAYLISVGLTLEEKNYRTRRGEIDLIMRDKETLVFIEVRYREQDRYGGAIESVTTQKQKKIILAAQQYLQQHGLTEKIKCRFDVICLQSSASLQWIKDAFQVE